MSPAPSRRSRPSTNPVLIGTSVLAVIIVGVFLSYNANRGLPYVPVYQLRVEVPDAARLVAGSEVRIGGARVGQVQKISAVAGERDEPPFARLEVSIDKKLEGLPRDTRAAVRPRSILGATFLELVPGRSREDLSQGATLPLEQAIATEQLDESFNVFDEDTRNGLQGVTIELGNAVAGRGPELNEAIVRLNELMPPLGRVLRTLRSPQTDIEGFVAGVTGLMQALEPVRGELGSLFDGAATTMTAIDRAGVDLDRTLERVPRAAVAGVDGLRAIRPVVIELADIARLSRPGTRLLPRTSTQLAQAIEAGTPVLRRVPRLARDLGGTANALTALARDPATSGALRKLTATVALLRPTLEYLVPAQTQCNILGVFTRNAASSISQGDRHGTWFGLIPIIASDQILQAAQQAGTLHNTPYPNLNASECEAGNEPFRSGRFIGNPEGHQLDRTNETTPESIIPTGGPAR